MVDLFLVPLQTTIIRITAIMKNTLYLFLLSLSLSAFAAPVRIFDFSTGETAVNESLPPAKRGVETGSVVDGIDGLPLKFHAYTTGNAQWPYLSTKPGMLGISDWRKYRILRCGVRNTGSVACNLKITVRDTGNKYAVTTFPLKAGFSGNCEIQTASLAKQLDLAKIRSVDFALSKPEKPVNLLLTTLELDNMGKTEKRADGKRILGRVFDLRKASIQTTGKGELKRLEDGSLVFRSPRYRKGDRGCHLIFSATSPDISVMTHISYEVELLSPYGNYFGLSIADANGKSMWQGIGTPGKNFPIRGSQQLYNSGLALDQMKSVTLLENSPSANDQASRIRKLQFEFRPEVIREQTQSRLDILKRQSLNTAERKHAEALQKQLDNAYAPVRGDTFRYNDAARFLADARNIRQEALAQLREYNKRAALAATGLGYGVGTADSMTSVFLTGPGSELNFGKAKLEMASNEYESFQTVIIAGKKPLKNIKVEIGPFSTIDGKAPQAECAVVGHSKTQPMLYPREHTGFYPEFILEKQKTADAAPGESVPFWVRIHTPKGTPPGHYTAQATVSGDGISPFRFPVEIEVFNFTLPDGAVLPTSFSFDIKTMTNFYGLAKDHEASDALIKQMVDLAAKYKITYDQMYWWGLPGMKRDNFFHHLKRLDDAGILKSFALTYLNQPGKNYSSDRWLIDPADPEVDRVIDYNLKFLALHVPKLKELGILDKAYIYGFDEGTPNAVTEKICGAIKKAYPEIPIMTTMRYGDPSLPAAKAVDIWVPIAPRFAARPDLTGAFRKSGRKVWWYLCDFPRPPEPTFMLEVPAAVPRLFMGMMTEKYRPDGFLYWAATYWRNNKVPIGKGPYTNWNPTTCAQADTSEGNLFAPGENRIILPSIRVENYRDGVEDHWYYTLLSRAVAAGKGSPEARSTARDALKIPESVIRSTADYSIDPRLIRAERLKAARALEALKQ